MARPMHPTRDRLIEVTVELLDSMPPEDLQVELLLTTSGISRGSLYHHFEDFGHVIETALVRRFSRRVDEDITFLSRALAMSKDRDEFLSAVAEVTRVSQSAERRSSRFERVRDLGMAGTNERFRVALGVEQARLTSALSDLMREAQVKGWVLAHLDPTAVAVFLQAYTMGRVMDDVSPNPMDPEAWVSLIATVQLALVHPIANP